MRTVLTIIAIVLAVGAGFDLLITLDLAVSHSAAATVREYLAGGPAILAWAGEWLAQALPDTVLAPVMTLAPAWFFPARAVLLGVCAVAVFALVRSNHPGALTD